MTSIYVKDEKMTVASLCAMINKAEDMTVFKLEDMVLDGSNNDVIELSKAFRGHQYLEEFTLENVSLTDASLTLDQVVAIILVTVPDLTLLKLEKSCVTTSALAAVGYCTSLKRLIVPNSNLNDKDAVKIAEAVAQSPGIEEVDMSGNDFSDLGCVAFANALDKNTSIREIKLDGNGKISAGKKNQIETTLRDRAGGSAQAA